MPKIIPDLVYTQFDNLDDQIQLNYFSNVLIIFRKGVMFGPLFDSVNSSTFAMIVPRTTDKQKILEVLKTHFTCINKIGFCFPNPTHKDDIPVFLNKELLFLKNEQEPYSENVQFMINIIKEFNVNTIDFLAPDTLNDNYLNYYNILSKETNVIIGASSKTNTINYGKTWETKISMVDVNNFYFEKTFNYYNYLYNLPRFANTGRSPSGIVLDSYGNVYISNYHDNNVSKISLDGTSVILGRTGSSPLGIAIDSRGNIYTANENSNDVSKITPDGISTIFANTERNPLCIVVDVNDNIYVTNSKSHNITKITPDGVSSIFANTGKSPFGIVIDSCGNIYISNNDSNTISKITPNGDSTIFADNIHKCSLITMDSYENLYVSSINCRAVYKITPDGTSTVLQLNNYPIAVAIDSLNNIYVNFYKSKYIYIIKVVPPNKNDVKYRTKYELVGNISGHPGYMIIDKSDNIYITNTTNNVLHKDKLNYVKI